jgi:hypothetical protein
VRAAHQPTPREVQNFGAQFDHDLWCVYGDELRLKLCETSAGERCLFDLTRDPAEQHNLLDGGMEPETETGAWLQLRLAEWREAYGDTGDGIDFESLDERTVEDLRALGYVE